MEIKARILVVDDNCDLCDNIIEILEGCDYFAECAVNGKEAIELARNNKYDIALIDVKLPDISGDKVVEKISEISPSTDFIYMTGHATIDSTIEAIKQERVVSYEIKPLDLNHFLSVIKQVIERKKAEEELIKYKILFDNISDLAYIYDTGGNILYLNSIFEKFSGHKLEEFIGKPFAPLFDGEELKKAMDFYSRTLKGESSQQEVYFKDTGVLCEYKGLPLRNENGEIVGVIGTARDITERKQMEETLLQSEKLKSIGTITAGISHEFNNILAIISGKVQLLEMDCKDNKELSDALRTIMKAADDGAAITSKMLQFTKTYQDTKELVSSDIMDLIVDSIDFTKPRWINEAQARGINYKMNTESMKKVPSIMCKPAELREIFINIISNSLDAMPEGGSISFSTWSVDNTVFIDISDTGEGMSVDVMKNIFDPFFSTKGVNGTGLGMSIVYGIVTRHGGKIVVSSEIGKGTVFIIQFPTINKRRSQIGVSIPELETNGKNLHILVVDDEDDLRSILDQLLSRDGHKVKTVDNGADAIEMIEIEDFDLVLCDLAMPDVFGYDVVKALNGLKKRPKIGIISGWSEKLAPVAGKEYKVDFYLKKPFKHTELIRHINELWI